MKELDLRLLSVFDEVYKTRSVSGAADVLDMSQPAVSVALSKLRRHFGDPLFVRTSAGMEPTPLGEGLVRPVREALTALDVVLGHHQAFDPASSHRTFRVCMTDISQLVLLPRLWERLRVSAPHIHIEIVPLSADIGRQLESGEADLALGFMPQLEAGFYQTVLFEQTFVCLVSAHHPRVRKSLSLAQFQREDHAVISSSGAAPLLIDQAIAKQGIQRKVAIKIPNFIGAALVVEHTDLVITIPARLAEVLRDRGELRSFPVPFPLPGYQVKQHWHERYHQDPGSRWLRQVIAELMQAPVRTRKART
ncbi:MAG TPA: LysR family transcriptional regulator [Burkholderiaceae bacterium]|nr:LysR family transcriptional regulator [Burkholderiaceae bacterium]